MLIYSSVVDSIRYKRRDSSGFRAGLCLCLQKFLIIVFTFSCFNKVHVPQYGSGSERTTAIVQDLRLCTVTISHLHSKSNHVVC